MKATPAQQKDLLRLQEHDNRLTRVAHATRNLPQNAQLAAFAVQAEQLRRRLADATGAVEDAQAEQKRLEADIAVVEQRMARDNARLQATSSTKDVEALGAEIESLRRRRSTLEDAELEVMERAEAAEHELAAVQSEQAELQASVATAQEDRARELARLENERSDAEADRMVVAQGIPHELLDLYDRQRSRYGIGAAAVRGGVNLGSNLTLAPGDLNAVRNADPDEIVVDSESGVILIRDENS